MHRFQPGETAVRRDVLRGKVWSAHAMQVVQDTEDTMVAACGPGAESVITTAHIESRLTGHDALRKQALTELAAGSWQLDRWTWRDTVLLSWNPPGTYFSVNAFYAPSDDRRMHHWYVNFQRPPRRTTIGFDTCDLLVDLVVEPDLSSWRWKDEDEYAQGRRLGIVNDADHQAVEVARDQALAMIANQEGPFAADSGWEAPAFRHGLAILPLPADALTTKAAESSCEARARQRPQGSNPASRS